MDFLNESQNFDSFESNANSRPSIDRSSQFNQRYCDNMEFPMNVGIWNFQVFIAEVSLQCG